MTIDITYDKALEALNAAVAERGADFVYPDEERHEGVTCQYRKPDGTGSCIVGMALILLGVPAEEIPAWGTPGQSSFDLLWELRERGIITFDRAASDLFSEVQDRQDCGTPWGQAVTEAVEQVKAESVA